MTQLFLMIKQKALQIDSQCPISSYTKEAESAEQEEKKTSELAPSSLICVTERISGPWNRVKLSKRRFPIRGLLRGR